MFSPKHIIRVTGVALVACAVAAPTALARPARYTPPTFGRHVALASSATPAAKSTPPAQAQAPTYSRQDKQLVPSSPTQAPAPAAPTVVSSSNPNGSFDWSDAAIGAGGGVALSIIAIGGALGLQRRSRRPGIRTSASIAAS